MTTLSNNIVWDGSASVGGTHFRAMLPTRDAFALTVAKLITLSGQRVKSPDDEKVSVEFSGTFRGHVFTLYDYKGDDEIHIGGNGALPVAALAVELLAALREAQPTPFTATKVYYDQGGTYGWPAAAAQQWDNPNTAEGLHLTVTKNGLVSLWDTARRAKEGNAHGETYLQLKLTPEQQSAIADAARRAL